MPYCPKCRYEYKPEISSCPDCGDTLVATEAELPQISKEPEPDQYESWVKLARLTSKSYSEMIIDGLRAKDIPAVSLSESGHFGQIGAMGSGSYAPVGGGYVIVVPEEFVEQADIEAENILGDVWTKSKI